MRVLLLVAVALATVRLPGAAGTATAPLAWTVTDLGTLPGAGWSAANAINERGQVAGWSGTAQGGHAALWSQGRIVDLGVLPGDRESNAIAINARGEVIGESGLGRGFVWKGGRMRDLHLQRPSAINSSGQVVAGRYLWQNGKKRDLGVGSDARAINESGQVAGAVGRRERARRAFLWQAGRRQLLSSLRASHWSSASGINRSGLVIGQSENELLIPHAVLWQHGQIQDLGILPGYGLAGETYAAAVNDKDQIAGTCTRWGPGAGIAKLHAFLWQDGTMIDLGTLPGDRASDAAAINNRGQVVGESSRHWNALHEPALPRAVVWHDGMITKLPLLPGGHTSTATAVNNRGQIVGISDTRTGPDHAVLWTQRVAN